MIYPVINIIAFLLVILQVLSFPQQKKEAAIQINNRIITVDEYENRLNSLPQLLKIPEDELKENLTCTLVAEAVLADISKKKGIGNSEKVSMLINQFKEEASYENWMNQEIRQKIKVSEKEIKDAYPRFIERRHTSYWVLSSKGKADSLRQLLVNGADPEEGKQEKSFEYSMAIPAIEDVVYNLQENGISSPVKVDSVYYIFKLIKKENIKEYSNYSYNELKPVVENRIRNRKENYLADEKINALMNEQVFTINKEAYDFLLSQLYPVIYSNNGLKYQSPEEIQQALLSEEIKPETGFNQTLIEFNNNTKWTVLDAWKQLSVGPYPLNYKKPQELEAGLFDVLRRIILLHSIARDAKLKKYDKSNYVKSQSDMWETNILAQSLLSSEKQDIEISNARLISYYDSVKNKYIKPELLKVIPLVVKTEEEIKRLNSRIQNGEDFITLASEYSMNKAGADRNNPGIFITPDTWGELGKAASKIIPGEVSPVVKNSDGTYAIIKLIEKKLPEPYSYEEIKYKLSDILKDKELQYKLNDMMSAAVDSYRIMIDRDALKKTKYMGGNMGVKKTHFPVRNSVPLFPLFDHSAKWYQGVIKNNR